MTQVMKQIGSFLAMMFVLVPLAVSQKTEGGTESGTLRQAAEPMGFWVGTTIQGRMWNRDPAYKPVMARSSTLRFRLFFRASRSRSGDV